LNPTKSWKSCSPISSSRTAARLPDRLQDYLNAFPVLSADPAALQQLQRLRQLQVQPSDRTLVGSVAATAPDEAASSEQATQVVHLSEPPPASDTNSAASATVCQTLPGPIANSSADLPANTDSAAEVTQVVRHNLQPAAAESQDDLATQLQQLSGEGSQLSPAMDAQYLQQRYRLDRLLGEGAFGRVYLGWDVQLQRQVAVKLPSRARFRTDAEVDIYLTEAAHGGGVVASGDRGGL
jgi:hypothetical protein